MPVDYPLPLLGLAFFAASMLYAAVGHGGASAYLAVMGLAGLAPATMKPVALTLNIAVSALALVMFDPVFKLILAAALLFGAWRLAFGGGSAESPARRPGWAAVLALGAALGFLSGLIGIGGGIFLTPLLILFGWAAAKPAAAVSSAFIFANSLAGLGGFLVRGGTVSTLAWMLLPAVIAGGWLGARWGSGAAQSRTLRHALATVLLVAAAKFAIV